MTVLLSPVGGVAAQFFDNNGNPLTGGKLFSYSAGSTTPAVTYTNSLGTTAHTNPIILDAGGRVPNGEIWLTDGVIYKFVLQTSTNVLIATYDNIVGINSNFVNYTTEQEIQMATAGQTVFNLTTTQYQPGTNSLSVFVDGVNQYGPGAQYAYLETDSDTVTFVSGLHVGASVKFTTATQTTGNATDASVVAYTPPFTGGVTTNVEDKLAQYISIKDFGAAGDGVADDTAAILAAISACSDNGGRLVFNGPGLYSISSNLEFPAQMDLIFEKGAYIKANGYTIYANVAIEAQDSTIISGAGTVNVLGGVKQVLSGVQIVSFNGATTQPAALRYTPLSIVQSNSKLTSSTPVVAGTGTKTFVLSNWVSDNLWESVLALNPWFIFSQSLGTASAQRLRGFPTAYNSTTHTVTFNITDNTLPAGTYSDWIFTNDLPSFIFANYSGSDNLQPGSGIIGWVGNSADNPPPYSYTIALYGGSGTIPTLYQRPNGRTGFGTEEPTARVHLTGNESETIKADLKLTRSLLVDHNINLGWDDQTYWGGDAAILTATTAGELDVFKYPQQLAPLHHFQRAYRLLDVQKRINSGNTYVNLAECDFGNSFAAVEIEVVLGGLMEGQFGAGAKAIFTVYQNASYTPIVAQVGATQKWGFGSSFGANSVDIAVSVLGTSVRIAAKSGLDPVNPIRWNAVGYVKVSGFPGYSGGYFSVV